MSRLRGSLLLAALFLVGLLAGAWAVTAPWVVGYPAGPHGEWTSMTWASVWAGAAVVTASAAGLVLAGAALLSARQEAPPGQDRP